jgi:[CysO sulfur-carrier protein]-thiocarboxylate-dependent cysteine synthase
MRFDDISQAIGNTPLVGLPRCRRPGYRIYLKLEGAQPDRVGQGPRREVPDRAGGEERRPASPGQRILEPTSGNTGIGLAAICRVKGYPLTCVMPENTSEERKQLLAMFGVDLVHSPASEGSNGSVRVARELADADPDVYMPFQYGNSANALAHYETTAPEIIADLPDVAAFVAGLGTGGTVTGAGRRLKRWNPGVKVYAAEPEYGDLVYGLRNLDEGYVPEVLDQSVLDSRIKVNSRRALEWTRRLAQEEGIFAGVSTGASLAVAARVCGGFRRARRSSPCRPTAAGSTCRPARTPRGRGDDRRAHQRRPLGVMPGGPRRPVVHRRR